MTTAPTVPDPLDPGIDPDEQQPATPPDEVPDPTPGADPVAPA